VNASEEGDPVFSCFFKTELMVCLNRLSRGNMQIVIGPTYVSLVFTMNGLLNHCCLSIEYSKKKDKKQVISFRRDETIRRDDAYKSHVVSVQSGEPPSSVSRPPAKRKPGQVRPITKGKLLRKGGPSTSNVSSYLLSSDEV